MVDAISEESLPINPTYKASKREGEKKRLLPRRKNKSGLIQERRADVHL